MMSRDIINAALRIEMSDEQWQAVAAPLEPSVVVAGAGSGKTTSMAARVAYLVAQGNLPASEILGLTFTKKAAAALGKAVRTAVRSLSEESAETDTDVPEVMTYHAFAARIVSEFGLRLGIEPDSIVMTDGAREQLAYRWVCGLQSTDIRDLDHLAGKPVPLTQRILGLDASLAELAITPQALIDWDTDLLEYLGPAPSQKSGREMRDTCKERRAAAELVQAWRAYKLSRGVMDFADQLRYAAELVAQYPDISAAIRDRYSAVLLDEYQDTSITQRQLIAALFGEGFPLTAVGDPCQAIYGWRGASVDNIESFRHHFAWDSGVPSGYTLKQNRRSAPGILHHANYVSTDLRAQHRGVEPLEPVATAHGEGEIFVGLFESQTEELAWIVEHVQHLHARKESQEQSVAVLAGTAETLIRVDSALRSAGIATQMHGAAALLGQPAVRDVRAWLEMINEPTANAAFLRIAAGPRWRIGPRDLAVIGERARELADVRGRGTPQNVAEALRDAVEGGDTIEIVSLTDAILDLGTAEELMSAEAVQRCAEIAALLSALRAHTYESLPDFLGRVMRTIGIDVEVRLPHVDSLQADALAAFIDFASNYTDVDSRMGLGSFLVRLREAERFDVRIELDRHMRVGAVQLMTIHKAKGLEFDHVIVPFVGKSIFPNGQNRGTWPTSATHVPWPLRSDATPGLHNFPDRSVGEVRAKDLTAYREVLAQLAETEVDRLAYVALTRSRVSVAVTAHWWQAHRSKPLGPHRVLQASAEFARTHGGTLVRWVDEPGVENLDAPESRSGFTWPPLVTEDYQARLQLAAKRMRASHSWPESSSETVQRWRRTARALRAESEELLHPSRVVRLGPTVGATTFLRALTDPEAVALDTARPMPRKPSPAAARGTAWHAWVESTYGQRSLLDPEDLPGAADDHIVTDEQLRALQKAFEQSPYAAMDPVAIERPFALVVGGRVVNGRIDAVFGTPERYEVVDWKTGGTAALDPRQLAMYRLAWAQIAGVPWESVAAAFVMVSTGEVIRPDTDNDVRELLALGARA